MDANDVIELFDHNRHDRMNELQLLIAYTSMGKLDLVEEKLKEKIQEAEQERNLSSLKIPETALWVLTFNWRYNALRLEYDIELENQVLSLYDERILNFSKAFIDTVQLFFEPYTMYDIRFSILPPIEKNTVAEVELTCTGIFENEEKLRKELNQLDEVENTEIIKSEDNKTICTVLWKCR